MLRPYDVLKDVVLLVTFQSLAAQGCRGQEPRTAPTRYPRRIGTERHCDF